MNVRVSPINYLTFSLWLMLLQLYRGCYHYRSQYRCHHCIVIVQGHQALIIRLLRYPNTVTESELQHHNFPPIIRMESKELMNSYFGPKLIP